MGFMDHIAQLTECSTSNGPGVSYNIMYGCNGNVNVHHLLIHLKELALQLLHSSRI